MKLNLDMDNIEFYKHAKIQLKYLMMGTVQKITKSDIHSSEQRKLSKPQNLSDFLSFLWSLEYKVFGIETFHVNRTHRFVHLQLFT
jgi:hypothetical protein